jgi:type VI secretion ATPase, clpV1 family
MPAIAQSFLQWQQTAGHMPEHAKLELGEDGIDVLFE